MHLLLSLAIFYFFIFCNRTCNNQHQINQGIISDEIWTWDHVPLIGITPPNIHPD